MRIEKHGKPYEVEMECPYCGCVFYYKPGEIEYETFDNSMDPYVICPECKEKLYLYDEDEDENWDDEEETDIYDEESYFIIGLILIFLVIIFICLEIYWG